MEAVRAIQLLGFKIKSMKPYIQKDIHQCNFCLETIKSRIVIYDCGHSSCTQCLDNLYDLNNKGEVEHTYLFECQICNVKIFSFKYK
jgi:hypothetical protein